MRPVSTMAAWIPAWILAAGLAPACRSPGGGSSAAASASASASASGAPEPTAAATQGLNSAPVAQPSDKPLLGIKAFVATVYAEPRDTARKLGYLRVGAKVARSPEAVGKAGCPGGWYSIHPAGYVCAGDDATTDMDDPMLRAAARRPNLAGQLPYRYGFVRAVLPLYVRVPTTSEQQKSEFKLDEHLAWHKQNTAEVDKVSLGAWDVPIDARGVAVPGKQVGDVGQGKPSTELGLGELFGGSTESDPIPFWLEGGKRLVPNISDFKVPDYAVFADRARRHTGLAFVGSFPTGAESGERRFAITTDLRLAPTSKVKPDMGSPFHGVELDDSFSLPLAFVREKGAKGYKLSSGVATPSEDLDFRVAHALTGKVKTVAGVKYYRTKDKRWLHQQDVSLALPPATWPQAAEKGKKWIEVSIENQTLVLWEGTRPVYATLVSTGRDGMKDPKTTLSTVRGTFQIRNKHITATMDSNESSSVGGRAATSASSGPVDVPGGRSGGGAKEPSKPGAKEPSKPGAKPATSKPAPKGGAPAKAAPKAPPKPGSKPAPSDKPPDYIPRKGDGEYGITKRRGEGTFQLRDVPYIQYFESGYALHGAYWHDVFGTPRSHGCVNLSPIDSHRVFLWTEPSVPDGWHAVNVGPETSEGTTIIIHE
jgi:lipoprotein-anchoring transpeptidase ErfK/SrfK